MSDFLGSYDPKEVNLFHGVLQISGFADGTFITVAKTDKDLWKNFVGAHGEVTRTKNNNKSGMITFTLQSTSPSNAALDLLKHNPVAVPTLVKNNSGGKHIAAGIDTWIQSDPDKSYGAEQQNVEWTIYCAELNMSHLI